MVLFHTAVSIAGGLITVIIAYLLYRKKAVSLWGWIASFYSDLPVFLLVPLGATTLGTTLLLTHTLGILLFPLLLVLADIFLIGIGWVRKLSWLPYPKTMRMVKKFDDIMDILEQYNAIPRPIRVKRVYVVGVLAGVIHLLLNLVIGVL